MILDFTMYIQQLPPYVSWGQFASGSTIIELLPEEYLIPFLDYILEESKKDFPNPQIIAAGILYLESSGYLIQDIPNPQYLNALSAICHKYSTGRLNPIRTGSDPVFLGGSPLPLTQIGGEKLLEST